DIAWTQAIVASIGAIIGGQVGAYALHRVNEKLLRVFIIVLGLALAVGLFFKAGSI
ncbi:MAG: transporter, partial [Thermodesulfobium narugense]